eukprot:11312732-Prorocentrum_lima.AAC.1
MTSSLVGSEMCIRDRAGEAPAAVEGGGRDRRAVKRGARNGSRLLREAVSYTHLTLPTICSV